MKLGTILTVGAVALCGASIAAAAPSVSAVGTPSNVVQLRPRAGSLLAELSKLNLSDAQKAAIRGIVEDRQKQVQTIRGSTASTVQKREAVTQVEKASREQIVKELTPEQRAQLKGLRQDRPGAGSLAKIEGNVEALNLTDAQKTQIQGYVQDATSKAEALRGNTSLTPQQKRQEAQQLRTATRQQVLSTLTPSQRAQLKADRSGQQ